MVGKHVHFSKVFKDAHTHTFGKLCPDPDTHTHTHTCTLAHRARAAAGEPDARARLMLLLIVRQFGWAGWRRCVRCAMWYIVWTGCDSGALWKRVPSSEPERVIIIHRDNVSCAAVCVCVLWHQIRNRSVYMCRYADCRRKCAKIPSAKFLAVDGLRLHIEARIYTLAHMPNTSRVCKTMCAPVGSSYSRHLFHAGRSVGLSVGRRVHFCARSHLSE